MPHELTISSYSKFEIAPAKLGRWMVQPVHAARAHDLVAISSRSRRDLGAYRARTGIEHATTAARWIRILQSLSPGSRRQRRSRGTKGRCAGPCDRGSVSEYSIIRIRFVINSTRAGPCARGYVVFYNINNKQLSVIQADGPTCCASFNTSI